MNEQSSKELYLEENQSTNDDLNDELENDFTDEEEIPLTTQKILTLVGIGIGFFVLFVIQVLY